MMNLQQARRPVLSASTVVGGLALAGALLIAAGVALPWFSLFAGLRPMTALGTLNGYVLIAAAIVAGGLGLTSVLRGSPWSRRVLTGLGIGLVAFSAYLIVNLVSVVREVGADPLMVVQPGPGLGLVAAGAMAILATAFIND